MFYFLKKHVESVHEGKKPFDCYICDYSCAKKNIMKYYVESVHEGRKPFDCDICDYSCAKKSVMKNILNQFMKERNHLIVTFVITAVLKRVS